LVGPCVLNIVEFQGNTMKPIAAAFACVASIALAASPALADERSASGDAPPQKTVFDGDWLTVALSGVYGPTYDGADKNIWLPTPLIQGNVKGIAINSRSGGVALDLIPDARDARIGFILGPVATYSANRSKYVKDPVVKAAGKLKQAIDVGASGGIQINRLLDPYDSLSLATDVMWNVNGAYKGMTINPSINYTTPVSRAVLVNLSLTARHVDDHYAHYYYDVTPAQSAASGLPVYRSKGGWDNVSAGAVVAYDLSGDLADGGFAVFVNGAYGRMLGEGKRTPYTSIRGSADQWTIGAGAAYTF